MYPKPAERTWRRARRPEASGDASALATGEAPRAGPEHPPHERRALRDEDRQREAERDRHRQDLPERAGEQRERGQRHHGRTHEKPREDHQRGAAALDELRLVVPREPREERAEAEREQTEGDRGAQVDAHEIESGRRGDAQHHQRRHDEHEHRDRGERERHHELGRQVRAPVHGQAAHEEEVLTVTAHAHRERVGREAQEEAKDEHAHGTPRERGAVKGEQRREGAGHLEQVHRLDARFRRLGEAHKAAHHHEKQREIGEERD